MLEKVKLALRISHTMLDEDIRETISTARAEMIRAGITESKASDDADPLITTAIKTFCMYYYAYNEKMAEGYFISWQYQLDNLRKTAAYNSEESESDV